MAEIKVMISQHYRGGAWVDKATSITFDPRRDMGRIFSFSPALDLSGITESVRKNQLLPADKHTAILFQQLTRDMPVVFPQVVQVRSKRDLVEVVFDRPVYPLPGKLAHIPTQFGVVDILVTDAYMEGNSIAVFPINATGHIKIDADSFVDDNGNTNEAFDAAPKAEPVQAPVEEPVVEEAPVEEPEQVEEVEVKEVKKKPSRKKPAKKDEE